MVSSRIRRTLSFNKPSPSRQSSINIKEKSYHVRSVSLPCRSHPLLSQLKDEINELKAWASKPEDRTSAWLCDGIMRLKDIHESVDDLLQLPQTQQSLRKRSDWVENLLEDFLRFADAFGIFQTSLLTLKGEQINAQVSIRRKRDEPKNITSYIKARRNIERDMEKLVFTVRCIGRGDSVTSPMTTCNSLLMSSVSEDDVELAGILRDVNEVTVLVSLCVFNGISKSSAGTTATAVYCKSALMGFNMWNKNKKKNIKVKEGIREFEEVEVEKLRSLMRKQQVGKEEDEEVRKSLIMKMKKLENCIVGIENESERMFRSLINTRVSLLNILTQ